MIIKNGWENFINEVKTTDKPIVCFGAGAISIFIEDIFIEYGMWDKIIYFLDNNPEKEGKMVGVSKEIPIITVNSFREQKISDFIFLITTTYYEPIENQFNQYSEWSNISSYKYINFNKELIIHTNQPYELLTENKEHKIPKIIHYCWFGKGEKKELNTLCINSWKKFCPDYQIIEWNEDNYDVNKTLYMKQAYENKKWAYVSDYARMDIIYNYGGIYLDTDVELLNSLDSLLNLEAFIAHAEWPAINSGAGFGAIKGNSIIKEILEDERNFMPFIQKDGTPNAKENGYYETKVFRNHGYKHPFLMQMVDGMLVLAPEIMATASTLGEKTFVTDRTISIHHCEGTWKNKKPFNENK